MSAKWQWILWTVMTVGLTAYLGISLIAQPSRVAGTFLPGETTHGHYQIELQCNECHTAGAGVRQDACTRCHGKDLKRDNDTHPRSKFTDPGKAHLVKRLDGRSCISCHREHVPERTLAMGLSLPGDYCWHCHQEVGEERPSHKGMAYDSCATAGCHNYHDNRALFEGFLVKHYGEPEMLDEQRVPERTLAAEWKEENPEAKPLTVAEQDAPAEAAEDAELIRQWAETAHAAAGVNCTACHSGDDAAWFDKPDHNACRGCHGDQVDQFTKGRHGMRLAVGLSPMTPGQARLPMHAGVAHRELSCVACHDSHRFDTAYAAADACKKCHNDDHTRAYDASPHAELWRAEVAGDAAPGTGVSCATCHMPRERDGDRVFVQHNQNNNLRPNEKMVTSACSSCHGLQFSLDSLADADLVRRNFDGPPSGHVDSIDMAKAWVDERARLREERKKKQQARQTAASESGAKPGA
ncbi:MAG: ammonia-forming cytochrome c nitrite reductase subunit c552 [Planctomycetota bacterium]